MRENINNDNTFMSIYQKNKKTFYIIVGAVFIATLILDQVTKYICEHYIGENKVVPFLGNFMYFIFVKNYGASFGMLANWEYKNILFFLFTIIGVPVFIYILFLRRKQSMWGTLGMTLLLSGTIGNAIDRAMYSTGFFNGYVRDFICVPWFATFNIADSCMCVGIAMVILSMLFFDTDAIFGRQKSAEKEYFSERKALSEDPGTESESTGDNLLGRQNCIERSDEEISADADPGEENLPENPEADTADSGEENLPENSEADTADQGKENSSENPEDNTAETDRTEAATEIGKKEKGEKAEAVLYEEDQLPVFEELDFEMIDALDDESVSGEKPVPEAEKRRTEEAVVPKGSVGDPAADKANDEVLNTETSGKEKSHE